MVAHLAAAVLAAACPANVANDQYLHVEARQLITVQAAAPRSTRAVLRTWRRQGGCWQAVGRQYAARVGRRGMRAERREGDGTTPIGVFRIGRTMYGNAPNPGVRYRYRRLRCGDWWVEDPASPAYNTFRHVPCGRTPPFRTPTGDMSTSPSVYPYLAVVEFNMRPVVPGRGSGIFLHARGRGATNGCISIPRADLRRVLRWLDPARSPRIAIGLRPPV